MLNETDFLHIHKSGDIQADTKTFCKLELNRCKKGAVPFRNRHLATCPNCLAVSAKTEKMKGI